MNCRRARHLLFDFFDGLSDESLRADVDRHLAECGECDRFASEMTRSLALLRRVPVEPLDENFNWKVRLAIHREKNAALARAQSSGAWVRTWNIRYAVSSVLAFASVLVVAAVLLRGGGVPAPVQFAEPTKPGVGQDGGASSQAASSMSGWTPVNPEGTHLVSAGGNDQDTFVGPIGAIDSARSEALIDSLINSDVGRMSAQERDLYIQRRIERLQHFQSQQSPPRPR